MIVVACHRQLVYEKCYTSRVNFSWGPPLGAQVMVLWKRKHRESVHRVQEYLPLSPLLYMISTLSDSQEPCMLNDIMSRKILYPSGAVRNHVMNLWSKCINHFNKCKWLAKKALYFLYWERMYVAWCFTTHFVPRLLLKVFVFNSTTVHIWSGLTQRSYMLSTYGSFLTLLCFILDAIT